MRLFIAIDLPDEVKADLWYLAQRLEHQARHARVVPLENYHLTCLFLGEVSQVDVAREALHSVRPPDTPIKLVFDGIGSFKKQRDYTWWVGVKKTNELKELVDELTARYRAAGFSLESRSFKPHITLARRVRTERLIELEAPLQTVLADRLSLMRSTSEGGHMVYTELDATQLC